MKHNTTILIVLIVTMMMPFYAIAQQYQPLPDSNASWIIEEDDGYGGMLYHKYSLSPFLNDTLINSKTYTKVYLRVDTGNSQYFGAFRNAENGKSYWKARDLQNEYLLRDFTKQAGDTIVNVAYQEGPDPGLIMILDFIIDSTDVTNSGPYSYKIIYLSTVVEDTVLEQGYQPLIWIEQIGSFGGGIVNSFTGGLSARRLYCMQYNDTIYYNSSIWIFLKSDIMYQYGECNDPVGIEDKNEGNNIAIAPNPFTSRLNISNILDNDKIEINILNILGQVVYDKMLLNVQQYPIVINTTRLNPGIYILKVNSSNKLLLTQKIVKK